MISRLEWRLPRRITFPYHLWAERVRCFLDSLPPELASTTRSWKVCDGWPPTQNWYIRKLRWNFALCTSSKALTRTSNQDYLVNHLKYSHQLTQPLSPLKPVSPIQICFFHSIQYRLILGQCSRHFRNYLSCTTICLWCLLTLPFSIHTTKNLQDERRRRRAHTRQLNAALSAVITSDANNCTWALCLMLIVVAEEKERVDGPPEQTAELIMDGGSETGGWSVDVRAESIWMIECINRGRVEYRRHVSMANQLSRMHICQGLRTLQHNWKS